MCTCGTGVVGLSIHATLYLSNNELNVRCDLSRIKELLDKLRNEGKLQYEVVDISKLTESEISEAYIKSIVPSVFHKYEVRRVFGTNRKSGVFFGKEQPALLLEGDIWEVFPHRENGEEKTIENFLSEMLKK